MKTGCIICLFFCLLIYTPNKALAFDTRQIYSKILKEERALFIHLPKSYYQSDSSFPVLFILDGGYLVNDWPDQPSFARQIDSLTKAGEIPEIIAVGIANVNRIRDFNPTNVKNYPASGGADRFLDFFYTEIIPFMDQNYKTSNKRLLYGHSAGGLLTIYSFLTKAGKFHCCIAASPGLSWDNEYVINLAETKLPKMELSQNVYLYMSLGEKDYPSYIKSTNKFSALLRRTKPVNLDWNLGFFPGLNHNKAAHKSFVEGLQACFN